MSRYIPFPMYADDVPIDISFIFGDEKPAGKHGFLKADGEDFRFEDGTVGKFWGTNFNGGACFPSFEYSERVARRLAKTGCNIVRFHQLDAEWNTPNIFAFTKGRRLENTRTLDEESLKRLDYLIYCLKNEGIYCYLDMLTYRKFKSGDGVENAVELLDAAKPYSIYDPRMIELQKEFAKQLWTHYNPYTKLKYSDDPVFVMCEVTNECDLYSLRKCTLTAEPYVTRFREKFAAWLTENGHDPTVAEGDINDDGNALVIDFKMKLTADYYTEMMDYIRSLGVKIPLTGTNWTKAGAIIKDHLIADYTDSHPYFYDWRWGEVEKFCTTNALTSVKSTNFGASAHLRMFDKPFFLSEWDMPWPNPYRAESPLLYAAISSLQNWAGMAIHTYAYGTRLDGMKILGKEVSSASIGGVPYREGIFSTWNDPAKFGLFYHSALIVRRADVSPAERRVACDVTELGKNIHTAADLGIEQNRIGACFDGKCAQADEIVPEGREYVDASRGEVRADNGQMYRSWARNYGYIDTDRTKSVYGQLAKQGKIELDGMSVTAATDFTTITVSSLCDKAIENSDNMLLTAVGRARNDGSSSEGDKFIDFGHEPILIEVAEAEISIKTDCFGLRVWAINAEGMSIGALPTKYEDGRLIFTIGDKFPSMYYLIQAE